jgi:anti-anti-sigma regulatory factor
MTVNAVLETEGQVTCSHLADGKIVRLSGAISGRHVSQLRLALLMPLPDGCQDIVVDAGEVTHVDDEALSVLLAAPAWAGDHGGRMLLSRSAPVLDDVLDELDLMDDLPRLRPLGQAPARTLVPTPRTVGV